MNDPIASAPARQTDAAADARLTEAVHEAFALPCPTFVADRICAEVSAQESALRAWQAKWLFAVPVLEFALIMFLRTDIAAQLSLARRVFSAATASALPNWQGCQEVVQSWWQLADSLVSSDLAPTADVLPWVLAGLATAAVSAVVILRQESSHV